MKLNTLLSHLISYQAAGGDGPEIKSVDVDSREVRPGSLFVCIKGYNQDGHQFVKEAVANGAVAVVAEEPVRTEVPVTIVKDTARAIAVLADAFYGHPSRQLHLVGVTGTNGKTTTTKLIERILSEYGQSTGLIGTMGMLSNGKPLEIKSTTPTTPEADTLQKSFAQMVEDGVQSAVMEVSSHALDMGRVRGCDYNIAVFTNLSQDHLEYHPSMEHYLEAKGLLFSHLGNTYDNDGLKAAVLNADDEYSVGYLKRVTAAQMMTYGIKSDSDVMAKRIQLSGKGTRFDLESPFGSIEIQLQLIGEFNVYNALAAASACLLSGVPLEEIKASLEAVEGIPGRFEPVDEGQPYTVIVDYAHTPDSLENVLTTVNDFAEGKVYVVAGCGGDRDKTKRPLMAQVAVKYSDQAVFTSDNPRSEDPEAIIRDMEAGVNEGEYVSIVDRREAIRHTVHLAEPGDVIVIAGKGHETYQIVGGETLSFDDRLEARQAIKEQNA